MSHIFFSISSWIFWKIRRQGRNKKLSCSNMVISMLIRKPWLLNLLSRLFKQEKRHKELRTWPRPSPAGSPPSPTCPPSQSAQQRLRTPSHSSPSSHLVEAAVTLTRPPPQPEAGYHPLSLSLVLQTLQYSYQNTIAGFGLLETDATNVLNAVTTSTEAGRLAGRPDV